MFTCVVPWFVFLNTTFFISFYTRIKENCLFLGGEKKGKEYAVDLQGELVLRFRNKAKESNVDVLLCLLEKTAEVDKVHNTATYINRQGEIVASYRKLHLFDLDLGETKLKESEAVTRGESVVAVHTEELGVVGLSICYDLRFPYLFNKLAFELGAELVVVPSAFTVPTGKAHWKILLQARAIENQCFVVAPAQVGRHNERRESYGHSMVVSPWGEVLACIEREEKMQVVEVDLAEVERVRSSMPLALHRIDLTKFNIERK